MNMHSAVDVRESFFPDAEPEAAVVFHCEFSHNRGPELAEVLRQVDRAVNQSRYPTLYYPRLFVLDGGFREFFGAHPEDCEGTYMRMDEGTPEQIAGGASFRRLMLEDYKMWKNDAAQALLFPELWQQAPEEEMAGGDSLDVDFDLL